MIVDVGNPNEIMQMLLELIFSQDHKDTKLTYKIKLFLYKCYEQLENDFLNQIPFRTASKIRYLGINITKICQVC